MTPDSAKWMKVRLNLLIVLFLAAFGVILGRAAYLQLWNVDELKEKSRAEIEREFNLGAVRGEIYDARGEKLAASLAVESLFADTTQIENPAETAKQLSEILQVEEEPLKEKLFSGKNFIWLKRQVTADEADKIKALNLKGLSFNKEYRRAYPNGTLAAHFLGFVGIDGQGLEGLELALDAELKAGPGRLKVKRDNLGRMMMDANKEDKEEARGDSVMLTIDRRIQYIAEKALHKAIIGTNAKSGHVLIMRPKTGAVVASAVYPTFDPNDYKSARTSARRNRILTDPFEPGSTFKIFVIAAALETGLISPDSVIYCENGAFRVANHTVRDTHGYGDLTVSQVIKYSSNIGSLKIGEMLGPDLLYNYLTRFSFGEKTGLEHLPGEAPGLLRLPKAWHKLDAANIAFGQGISVTAMQMVMAMSALANDGVMMKPYLVERVMAEDGTIVEQHQPEIIRQVVSPLTARQVSAMLRMAVMKGGTGYNAEVAGYPVAGKTGTAQKVSRGGSTYASGKYVASFLGFAPYHNPELCMLVVLDEPWPAYYGGTVAAPIFKEIMENALPLLDLPPTEDPGEPLWPHLAKNKGGAPGVMANSGGTNFIRGKFKKSDLQIKGPVVVPVAAQNDFGPAFEAVSDEIVLTPGKMPDLRGLSMRKVLDVMSSYSMQLEYLGSGRVIGQTPLPGEAVSENQFGQIIFERQ